MVRAVALCLLAALPASALDADDYFELGLDYLRKGFYRKARAAFSESLVRAPGEAVPTVFLGISAAAEGRSAALCSGLLRRGYARLPEDRGLRLDLRRQLPSARALKLLHADFTRRLSRAEPGRRKEPLAVLAFLEVQDGSPKSAPALRRLMKEHPKDAFALALARLA